MSKRPETLWSVLREFTLHEVLRADLALGIAGGAGACYLAVNHRETLDGLVGPVTQAIGVIVGLAVAGLAVQAAFFDQELLRKLRAIGREPTRYVAPLLFTATLGVFALLATIVFGGLPPTSPTWLVAGVGTVAGLFTFWTLGSLLHNLTTLVSFIGLQADAAEVPEDLMVLRPETDAERTEREPRDGPPSAGAL